MDHTPHDAQAPAASFLPQPSAGAPQDTPPSPLQPHEVAALHSLLTAPQHVDEDEILAFAKNPALRAALSPEDQAALWEAVARLCEAHAHMVYDQNYGLGFG